MKISSKLVLTLIAMICLVLLPIVKKSDAAFNEKINYQAKLTDSSGVTVTDGAYDVVFKLYTTAGGGAAIWTESWTSAALFTETGSTVYTADGCAAGIDKMAYTTNTNESTLAAGQTLWNTTLQESAVIQSVSTASNYICVYDTFSAWANGNDITNRIYIKNGLFSTMLGSVQSLGSVDFNQTLFLGVTIGADSEMKPRKMLGALPAAFEAKELGGKTESEFATLSEGETIDGDWISSGFLSITHVPTGTGVGQGSLYINPASATADFTLLGIAVNGTQKFRLDADGDLAMAGALSVDGNTTLGNASGDTVTSNSASWTLPYDTSFSLTGGVNGLSFDTSTLSIDSTNHRVGVGTTSPQEKLHVYGTGAIVRAEIESGDTNPAVLKLTSTRGSYGLAIDPDTDALHLYDYTDIAAKITLLGNGNVGIGTTNPNNPFEVKSTTTPQFRIAYNDSNYATVSTASNGAVTLDTNGTGAAFTFSDSVNIQGSIKEYGYDLVPVGTIVMWNGASVPSGWGLCDGTVYAKLDGSGNITSPNLVAKFIRGGDTGTVNNTGGADSHKHTMGSHTHSTDIASFNATIAQQTTAAGAAHTHVLPIRAASNVIYGGANDFFGGASRTFAYYTNVTGGSWSLQPSTTSSSTGAEGGTHTHTIAAHTNAIDPPATNSGVPSSNDTSTDSELPTYWTLMFIIKL
jgi:hypothetical protein